MLFSLGHSAVVVAIALTVGPLARQWQVPGWMEDLGAWISIAFLFLLGTLNLTAVLTAAPDQVARIASRVMGLVAPGPGPGL